MARERDRPQREERLSVAALLGRSAGDAGGDGSGGGAAGFARALGPRQFAFPADHGPHPEFRTEWWYFTGNLATASGRRFGFQLTFFRAALAPRAAPRSSAWAAREVYLAHFTVTDVAAHRFRAFERWQRAALGLAGAQAEPFRVWAGNWSAAAGPASGGGRVCGGATPPIRLTAAASRAAGTAEEDTTGAEDGRDAGGNNGAGGTGTGGAEEPSGAAIDLTLHALTPPVLEGDRGLSRKGGAPDNASYYYSLPRLAATGSLAVAGERYQVSGLAWMDREWSTSALAPDEVGWDWFGLQLADGTELMLYRLRRQGGGADPASGGTLIGPRGEATPFALIAARLEETGSWRSERSGARYPAGWRLALPAEELELTIRPLVADQELDLSFRYWEGAVAVAGRRHGRAIAGLGYVELTGYADSGSRTRR
ncbi:MAG TPA: lipocalin-like domain-containing protein [Thermoanaerobaculia bacterium]|nr:lipocalin-like domain-containing protein [Thermoanaerobaculia bacterium]